MSKQQANKLTKKKLLGALAAGAASVYGQTQAEAGIVWTGASGNAISGDTVLSGDNDAYVAWDIDGDGNDDAKIIESSTSFKDLLNIGNRASFILSVATGKLQNLTTAQVVGSTGALGTQRRSVFSSGLIYEANFTTGVEGYFGFKLNNNGSSYWGWAKATLTNGNNLGSFYISEWAYNNVADAPITVGDTGTSAVPEPSSFAITGLGLLAAGAGGVRRWRREKKVKAA